MSSMTFSDEMEEPWRLRSTPIAEDEAAETEERWTPAMARVIATIVRALETFPEALAAVQMAMATFEGSSG
jgi:hypothetical protein